MPKEIMLLPERKTTKEGILLYTHTYMVVDGVDQDESSLEQFIIEIATTLKGRIVYIVGFDLLNNPSKQIRYNLNSEKFKEIESLFNNINKSSYRQ